MPPVSFASLSVVLATAFAARLVLGLLPRVRVPGVAVEIVAGIVVGPHVLGWARDDEPVALLATLGVTLLLFLAGLEIDLGSFRGPVTRLAGSGFVASVVLALAAGVALGAVGAVRDPLLAAVALSATSLGLVAPALQESGRSGTPLGTIVTASATLADFGAVIALSLLFSRSTASLPTRLVLLGAFAVAALVVAVAARTGRRSARLTAVVSASAATSAQLRVRGALVLMLALVVVAQHTGLETILAAFVAGMVLSTLTGPMSEHPLLRTKLDAIGHGFLVPVFFVASGLRFDLPALGHAAVLARVPLYVGALLVVRGGPALLYRRHMARREVMAAALLQATSLPFLVTASMIGVEVGALDAANGAALVAAGLVSGLVFPSVAVVLMGDGDGTSGADATAALSTTVSDVVAPHGLRR